MGMLNSKTQAVIDRLKEDEDNQVELWKSAARLDKLKKSVLAENYMLVDPSKL